MLALALLLGAPLDARGTWLWLSLQAAAAAPFVACSMQSWDDVVAYGFWPELWLHSAPLLVPAGLSLCGSWLGAVVIPLDWGQWWQAWPTGSIVCCIVGWMIGASVIALSSLLGGRRRNF